MRIIPKKKSAMKLKFMEINGSIRAEQYLESNTLVPSNAADRIEYTIILGVAEETPYAVIVPIITIPITLTTVPKILSVVISSLNRNNDANSVYTQLILSNAVQSERFKSCV